MKAERRLRAGGAIDVQIGAAHARRLYLEHDLARSRGRIGKIRQLQVSIAQKNYALHRFVLPTFALPRIIRERALSEADHHAEGLILAENDRVGAVRGGL